MKIVFFGLSITSSWGNGHATTFRALIKGLHERGHHVTFFEQNVEWYASNRDLPRPSFCRVHVLDSWDSGRSLIKTELRDADVAVVGSYFPNGQRAIDEVLNSAARVRAFYDIDTPTTVAQLESQGTTPYLRISQIPCFDIYFSFTAGPLLEKIAHRFGAVRALPLFCSVDPEFYFRRKSAKRFACDMSYMGTFAPDRQPKIEAWLNQVAENMPRRRFIVAGPQYPENIQWARNIRRIIHLNPRWHPHLYSSSQFTLNVTRRDMVQAGYAPSVRLFEAAACGAAIISDNWAGLDSFFTPGEEILLPSSDSDVTGYLRHMSEAEIRSVGEAAQARVLDYHTSAKRALEFESTVQNAARAPVKTECDAGTLVTAQLG